MSEILGSHRLEPFLEGATERRKVRCAKNICKRKTYAPLCLKFPSFFCWYKVAPDGICACVWMCINFMLMWKFLCSVHLLEVFRRCKWRICVCVCLLFSLEKVGFRVLLFPPVTCTWVVWNVRVMWALDTCEVELGQAKGKSDEFCFFLDLEFILVFFFFCWLNRFDEQLQKCFKKEVEWWFCTMLCDCMWLCVWFCVIVVGGVVWDFVWNCVIRNSTELSTKTV